MSHNELIVHGYIRLNFEQCDECQLIPYDINIKSIFCDYFGYSLCCIAFTKKIQLQTYGIYYALSINLSTNLTEFIENNKSFRLNEIKNVNTEINITEALYTAISLGHISCFNYLSPKQDNNFPTINNYKPLWVAARCNQAEIIKLLLNTDSEEMDPNEPDEISDSKLTPLMAACINGANKAAKVLINLPNIDINAKSAIGSTALNIACFKGHIECVRKLLNHENILIDAPKTNGKSPLWHASFFGYYEIIELLLNHSKTLTNSSLIINVNRCDSKGFTALFAAAQNGHANVVKLLLKNNADPSIQDSRQHSPLWISSLRGHVNVVRMLIIHPKVDINQQDGSGVTALWAASQEGKSNVVEVLLNPNSSNDDDDDALAVYQSAVYGNQQMLLRNQKIYQERQQIQAADPNIAKQNGCSAIWMAASRGHLECVKLLMKYGADVNMAHVKDGSTPLFVACQNGREDVVDLLLTTDIDVNKERDNDGTTPLIQAAHNGHTGIVNELLKHGANVKEVNETGLSVVACPAMNGHLDTLKLVYEYFKENVKNEEEIMEFMEKGDYTNNWTPLMFSCMNGHKAVAKYLVNVVKVNILRQDRENKTAMYYALQNGHQNNFCWLQNLEDEMNE